MKKPKLANEATLLIKPLQKGIANTGMYKIHNTDQNVELLLQELQIHQIELETQNDELRIANEQLELQHLKFAGIYDLAPIGYFILDRAGLITEVNNVGLTLLETGKAGVIGKRLQSFVNPKFADAFHCFFRTMLNSKSRQSCHLKIKSKEGKEFHVQMEGIALTIVPGHPLQFDIAMFDISERIRAEDKLANTKERLQLALAASAAGTWELELDTMMLNIDGSNFQNIAISPNFDNRYSTFIGLIHPDDRELVDRHFRVAINHSDEIDVSCRFDSLDGGTVYATIRGHLVTATDQVTSDRFVGIVMDVTDKMLQEEEARRLKLSQQKQIALATLQAEENERKRISEALHDGVSQLLYGIRIKLGGLNADTDTTAVVYNINELLDLAIAETRNISFELAPSILTDFGLEPTIDELAKRLTTEKMVIQTRITGFNTRPDLQLEIGIFRIIQELINNCMKHSEANLVQVEVKKTKSIKISVKDDGKGFSILSKQKSPSGSGLSSIKNRVVLYNGHMRIDSKPGLGTTVKINFDVASNQI